jgi:hypothetical protein
MAVKATCPRPAPCTVTDANPDVTTLLRDTALRLPTSAEYASDMLPDCSPTVMMARFVFARIIMLVKHMIAVLDDHLVPSQPVAPSRPTVLMSTVASPSPYTVTLALPVAGWLAWSNDDTEARSYDAVSVTMPLVDPTVTSADLVLATLAVVVLHIIATSDSQSLASGAVIPIRLF